MNCKTLNILKKLNILYPEAKAQLNFKTPFELLVATILSAQCTDKRVNIITEILFKKANTPKKIILLGEDKLRDIIKSCGLYKVKSKYIMETSNILANKFNSKLPENIEQLMVFPGVGRKTANVVVSNAFGIPAIAVDTHVFRVSNRLGIVKADNVFETEKQLMEKVDKDKWIKLHHQLIFLGREFCKAQNPNCEECILKKECTYYSELTLKG